MSKEGVFGKETEKDFEKLRKMANRSWEPKEPDKIKLEDNSAADKIDEKLLIASEEAYINIARQIVDMSKSQLSQENSSKNELKGKFTKFFIWFVSLQYAVLATLLLSENFCNRNGVSDTIMIAYISSVFVETLGAIIIMIRYAFDSKQEVTILEILNGVISSYKKFNEK